MNDYTKEIDSCIYRVTRDGKVFTQSKLKIPLNGKNREFSGNFKHILKKEKEFSYRINNRGYNSVNFANTTHMVHRLVAIAYIANPENKPFVNHKDGNKLNNNVDNLEWCTCAENNAHARETGLHIQAKGYTLNYKSKESKAIALSNLKDKSKLTDDEVRYVRSVHIARSKDYSSTALAKQFGTSVAAMAKIVKGQTYKNVK